MTCPVPNKVTTCNTGVYGDTSCTTRHIPNARTTCCTSPATDTVCRTTSAYRPCYLPYSTYSPVYTSPSCYYDCQPSYPYYSRRTYTYDPCCTDVGPAAWIALGVLGMTTAAIGLASR